MQRVTLLGSTGSIGQSTLDVIRQNPGHFEVFALVAGKNIRALAEQIREFRPQVAVVSDPADLPVLRELLDGFPIPELLAGNGCYSQVAAAGETDVLVSAIVGVAGMEATYQAICRRKRIGLANKETLVAGGSLIMGAVKQYGVELIPIDSEHNGAHQCFRAGNRADVTKLILTASGGPFRNTPKEAFASVTPKQALNHPTWKMGQRITIDSATLMNKGFEVIEACWLFDLPPDQVEVVVHPQSTVHAMVEYNDGSVIAQVCATDMRMPIQYALTWPDRWSAPVPRIDWTKPRSWDFHPPDLDKFPLLRLAYETQKAGGTATCTLNAADEVAVESFLRGEISFPGIAEVVEETLQKVASVNAASIAEVLDKDRESRQAAAQIVAEKSGARVPA
ncbi:MAG: 1-deoxy-D-xylulose-5-phosphate reductoisomerase [Acidobacteria bacterium]|nr:1-deoxy-D-xylulose-5-phosphate reductoisomerase [Acidobacteriota bacterium]